MKIRIVKQPDERKSEIIKTAEKLFLEKGVHNTKISEIVETIGVAKGLFYYYFKSKDDVINAVIEHFISELDISLSNILNSDMNYYKKISKFIDTYVQIRKMFNNNSFNKDNNDNFSYILLKKSNNLILSYLKLLISSGISKGLLRLRYPDETVTMLVYGLNELMDSSQKKISLSVMLALVEQSLSLPSGVLA